MKKICILLSLILVFSSVTAFAYTPAGKIYGNFRCDYVYAEPYTLGSIVITGLVDKNITALTVPGDIGGVKVSIGRFAFEKCPYLKTVIVGEGIEEIGEGAFYECKELASVFLPSTLKKIGKNVFEGSEKLNYAPIPAGAVAEGEEEKAPESNAEEGAAEAEEEDPPSVSVLPLRKFAEKGNIEISWNEIERKVTIKGIKNTIELIFGESRINPFGTAQADLQAAYKNGEEINLGYSAVIFDGSTFISKRIMEELFENDAAADMIWGLMLSQFDSQTLME